MDWLHPPCTLNDPVISQHYRETVPSYVDLTDFIQINRSLCKMVKSKNCAYRDPRIEI